MISRTMSHSWQKYGNVEHGTGTEGDAAVILGVASSVSHMGRGNADGGADAPSSSRCEWREYILDV